MAEVRQGDTVRPHCNIAGEPQLSWVLAVRHSKTWPKKLAMGVSHKTLQLRLVSIKPPISLRCFVQSLSEPELLKSGASAEACKNMPPPSPPWSLVWEPLPYPQSTKSHPKTGRQVSNPYKAWKRWMWFEPRASLSQARPSSFIILLQVARPHYHGTPPSPFVPPAVKGVLPSVLSHP